MLRTTSPHGATASKESLVVLETSKARKLKEKQRAEKGHPVDKKKGKHRKTTSSHPPQGSTSGGPGAFPTTIVGGWRTTATTATGAVEPGQSFMSRLFGAPAAAAAATPQPSDLIVAKRQRRWSWSRLWRWRTRRGVDRVAVAAHSTVASSSSTSAWSWPFFQQQDTHPYPHSSSSHSPHVSSSTSTSTTTIAATSSNGSRISGSSSNGNKMVGNSNITHSHRDMVLRPPPHQLASQVNTAQQRCCHQCDAEDSYPHYNRHGLGGGGGAPLAGTPWPSVTHDKYGIGVVASVFFAFWSSQPEWFRFGMFMMFAVLMLMLLTTLLVVACSLYKGMSVVGVVAYGLDDFVRGGASLAQRLVRFFVGR